MKKKVSKTDISVFQRLPDLTAWLSCIALFLSICSITIQIGLFDKVQSFDTAGAKGYSPKTLETEGIASTLPKQARGSSHYVKEKINDVFDQCHYRQKQKVMYGHRKTPNDRRAVEVEFSATRNYDSFVIMEVLMRLRIGANTGGHGNYEDEEVMEKKGYIILTADCSSIGAPEKYFFQPDTINKRFLCRCVSDGNDEVFKITDDQGDATELDSKRPKPISCVAHYWECPVNNG